MFEEIKARIISFLTSRFILPFIMLGLFVTILISKIFSLQIVNGDYYRSNFTLSIEKQVSLPSTRGNIYDRNGVLLAYNELAYSVTITDTIESGSSKNRQLNDIIIKAVRIIEKNNDSIISDFGIYIDENDNYCFSYTGTKHQRFLADIYGKSMISDLSYEQRTANPDEVMSYLCSKSKYGVGTYSEKNGSTSGFMAMMGYTKKEMLDIVIIRYKMGLNAFQKYIATTIATDVSEETVAEIMENENLLQGVTIAEDTIRRYNHSVYFSQIIGYTGRISEEEYEEYSASDPNYSTNDYVGKTGIEYSMESELQGQKGSETLFVDNLGKILETENVVNPVAGNDVYLTIDSELQMAVYHLLEQKIAGILVSRIVEDKDISTTGRNKMISIYDIYYALISNHVIDLNHMDKTYAAENEKAVYAKFDAQRDVVITELRKELTTGNTVYSELPPHRINALIR